MLDGREDGDASDLFMINDDETNGDGERSGGSGVGGRSGRQG